RAYSDFRVYYEGGKRFLAKENIYSRPDPTVPPYKYSPVFAMGMALFALFDLFEASLLFWVVNFLALIGCLVVSAKLANTNSLTLRQRFILYFLVILFSSRFILQVFDHGQVSLIMLFLVLWGLSLAREHRPIPAALALGGSMMIKYMSVIFVPYFFIRQRFRLAIGVILSGVVLILIPMIYVGVDQMIVYLKAWLPYIHKTGLADELSWYNYKNQSIFAVGLRFLWAGCPYPVFHFALSWPQTIVIASVAGLLIYGVALWPRKKMTSNIENCDIGLLLLCMALFNPNSWFVNFVVFIFVYMFLGNYLIRTHFRDKITGVLVLITFMLASVPSESLVGNYWESLIEQYSSIGWSALLLAVTLIRLKFSRLLDNE
ncbi:MAG: glycosyltransferase family 87 protein, partial [Candidatus Omnitrophota bacterium]|nr:glycosyltransferase family 87 protein [Candidatus Omnitrophota bacterium]